MPNTLGELCGVTLRDVMIHRAIKRNNTEATYSSALVIVR